MKELPVRCGCCSIVFMYPADDPIHQRYQLDLFSEVSDVGKVSEVPKKVQRDRRKE